MAKRTETRRPVRWFSRIWIRFLLAFFACIVPLLIIQLYIQRWSSRAIEDQVYSSAYADIAYLRDQFSENAAMIQTNMQYTLDAKEIRAFFVYHDRYTQSELVDQATDVLLLLQNMRGGNTLVKQLFLYYPRQGVVFQSSSARKGMFPMDAAEFAGRYDAWKTQGGVIVDLNGSGMLCASRGDGGYGSTSSLPAIYLVAELDTQEILKYLSSFGGNMSAETLQYNHAAGSILPARIADFSDGAMRSLTDAIARQEGMISGSITLSLDGREYVLIAGYASSVRSTFGRLIPADELNALPRRLRRWMLVFSLSAALMLAALSIITYRQAARPTTELLRAFDRTARGQFDTRIQERSYPYEYDQLRRHFNDMNLRIGELIEKNYEYTIDLKEAEFRQLQAQINPHFLYNSFFLLRSIISAGETEQCERFLTCLGSYFQYIARNEGDTAMLSEEYEHAASYLTIQAMRFEDDLQLDLPPLPDSWRTLIVPRLILQPLLENVMVHGVWSDCVFRSIRLSFREDADDCLITVDDNGQGVTDDTLNALNDAFRSPGAPEHTSGLLNIHRRIRLYYGRGGLSAAHSDMGGFSICLRIPRRGDELHE